MVKVFIILLVFIRVYFNLLVNNVRVWKEQRELRKRQSYEKISKFRLLTFRFSLLTRRPGESHAGVTFSWIEKDSYFLLQKTYEESIACATKLNFYPYDCTVVLPDYSCFRKCSDHTYGLLIKSESRTINMFQPVSGIFLFDDGIASHSNNLSDKKLY